MIAPEAAMQPPRRLAIRGAIVVLASLSWISCGEATCDDPNDPNDCNCHGPCVGQWCVEGQCVGGTSEEACGPEGLPCAFGDSCIDGMTCGCDPIRNADRVEACGCDPAPVNCDELLDHEICIEGVCTCDLTLHQEDDGACGCNPTVACDNGFYCKGGECICDPLEHLTDSKLCGCQTHPVTGEYLACPAAEVCQAGRCVCPPGTIRCGTACIPLGHQCCDAYGAECPPGHQCELKASGAATCRPSESTPCYAKGGGFLTACGAGEACVTGDPCEGGACQSIEGGAFACMKAGQKPCYVDGVHTHACQVDETCSTDGVTCLPGSWTLCPDGSGCWPGSICRQVAATLFDCQPEGTVPCYQGGWYIGACAAGQVCEKGADAQIHCRPSSVIPCYDAGGFYTGFCESGYTCKPGGGCALPGFALCEDGKTTCPPGETCRQKKSGFTCQPDGTVPCFTDGYFDGYCEAGYFCATVGGEKYCVPNATTPCYGSNGFTHFCESGYSCTWNGCLPPGWMLCKDESTKCAPGTHCIKTYSGWGCGSDGATECYADGAVKFTCNKGYGCGKYGCVSPWQIQCPDGTVCSSSYSCVYAGPGDYHCLPPSTVACYTTGGLYVGFCEQGFQCKDKDGKIVCEDQTPQ